MQPNTQQNSEHSLGYWFITNHGDALILMNSIFPLNYGLRKMSRNGIIFKILS